MEKTRIIFNSLAREQEFSIASQRLEPVLEYAYVGQLVTGDPDHQKEIYGRIKLSWSACGRHSRILTGSLPLSLKRIVYNLCILPVLTYGAETWRLTKKLRNKLRTGQRAMERKILAITMRARTREVWIREQTGKGDILIDIKTKKGSWARHVMRRADNQWTITVTEWVLRARKRSQGRQETRWRDEMKKFAGANRNQLPEDRGNWRSQEEAFVLQWT